MAYTTINKSSDYFNTKLYTGNASTNALTGVGFQPDMVWLKSRDFVQNHEMYDAVRTATKRIYPNLTNGEDTDTAGLTAFNSDGFTLGNSNASNKNGNTFASWNWKANGAGSANTDGSVNSTVSTNTTSDFSIVSWTATGSSHTIGHGLGSTPALIILKNRDTSKDYMVYHHKMSSTPERDYLNLNTNAVIGTHTTWNNTAPTSSVFSFGTWSGNINGDNIVAYCFAEKTGYSKFGSYTGNGSSNGTFIYTGFKPSLILMKSTSHAVNWKIHDNKRDAINDGISASINVNASDAEDDNSAYAIDFLSNGFKQRNSNSNMNNPGYTYVFMAFGQSLVGSNNVPCTAR